jgi:hypothetical protein
MNQHQQELKIPLADLVITALALLLGEEGRDYLTLRRDLEAWELLGWIRRN